MDLTTEHIPLVVYLNLITGEAQLDYRYTRYYVLDFFGDSLRKEMQFMPAQCRVYPVESLGTVGRTRIWS